MIEGKIPTDCVNCSEIHKYFLYNSDLEWIFKHYGIRKQPLNFSHEKNFYFKN